MTRAVGYVPTPTTRGAMTRYLGPLITDTSIPGERKADGIIPGHPGGGALRVAKDRWVIFFATLNPNGWDCNRSILYQLRADAPDGTLLREGVIDQSIEDWDPLERGDRFIKSCGMPIAFGVPRGATHRGQPMPNANRFVVKWYRWAHLRDGERILHPSDANHDWKEGLVVKQRTLRVEWMQFCLNEAGDDIKPLTKPAMLRQRGYEQGNAFCSLGEELQMNHAMKAPVAEDDRAQSWVSCDTFTPYALKHCDHGMVAPVRFTFNAATQLYEWTDIGKPVSLPKRVIGEASVNRIADHYVVCLRCFEYHGRSSETVWFKTDDLFASWGSPRFTPLTPVPRIAFTCGDGQLRLFSNAAVKGAPDSRALLQYWDVAHDSLRVGQPHPIFDARDGGLAFNDPLADMAKLCPPQGNRQLLLFRLIDRGHTANRAGFPAANPQAIEHAGIHAAELIYPEAAPEAWSFE